MERIFARDLELYHTSPKPSKVPTNLLSCDPPFVYTFNTSPSGDSPILVSRSLLQNTHTVDSLSRRIQLGLIREERDDWVSEKSKLTCLAAPRAAVAAAAAGAAAAAVPAAAVPAAALVPAARGQSIA